MTDNISSRILRLFERRLQTDPDVSAVTVRVLLEEQRTDDFGDDDEILTELLDSIENRQ